MYATSVTRATRIAAEITRCFGDDAAADRAGDERAEVFMVREFVGEVVGEFVGEGGVARTATRLPEVS